VRFRESKRELTSAPWLQCNFTSPTLKANLLDDFSHLQLWRVPLQLTLLVDPPEHKRQRENMSSQAYNKGYTEGYQQALAEARAEPPQRGNQKFIGGQPRSGSKEFAPIAHTELYSHGSGSRSGSKDEFVSPPSRDGSKDYRKGSKDEYASYQSTHQPESGDAEIGLMDSDNPFAKPVTNSKPYPTGSKAPWSTKKKIIVGTVVLAVLIVIAIFLSAEIQAVGASVPTLAFQVAHFNQVGMGTGMITSINGTQQLTIQNNNNFNIAVTGTTSNVFFAPTANTQVGPVGTLVVEPMTVPAKQTGTANLIVNLKGYTTSVATQIQTQENTNGQSQFEVNGGAILLRGKVAVGNAESTIPLVCSMTVANDNSVAFNCNNDATAFKLVL
jgi:hypothetical protein